MNNFWIDKIEKEKSAKLNEQFAEIYAKMEKSEDFFEAEKLNYCKEGYAGRIDGDSLFNTETMVVSHGNRKLRAVWSLEAAEDLRTVHNIDAETELRNILTRELLTEIDQEIIRDLRNNSVEDPYQPSRGWNHY